VTFVFTPGDPAKRKVENQQVKMTRAWSENTLISEGAGGGACFRSALPSFYLVNLVFDFSLYGVAGRKHAYQQGRAAKFYLLKFALQPRYLACLSRDPAVYFLKLAPRPRRAKVFWFAQRPR
jgi:hypothetical protein